MAPENGGASNPVFIGERTVDAIIPGAKAGELPPDQVLRVWHDPDRNIYVGVDPGSGWSDRDIAGVWRAIDTLEKHFPQLFSAVFIASNDGGTRFLSQPGDDPWTNRNKVSAFIIVAEGFQPANQPAMATAYYSLGAGAGRVYENVPFIGLNPRAIDGLMPNVGPRLIYPGLRREEARAAYFDEGLADSILHERIHAFISQFFGHDRLFNALRPSAPECEYDLEELLVKRYLLEHYTSGSAVFSERFLKYWREDAEFLARKVTKSDCYARIEQLGLLDASLIKLQ